MSGPLLIQVNDNCEDVNGVPYDHPAKASMVKGGFMINRPVLVQYPDGRIMTGTEVLITQRGLEKLKREFPLSERRAEGRG